MAELPEHYEEYISDGNEARMGAYMGGCFIFAVIAGSPIAAIIFHYSLAQRGLTEMQYLETAYRVITGQ